MQSALVVPELQPASAPLNFYAQGIVVDNLSSSWLYIPDLNRSVPPWTHAFSSPLLAANNAAVAEWVTPAGIVAPTSGGGKATLTYSSEPVPFSPGVAVTQATPSGSATPAQTHVIVDSGSIAFASPQPVTVSGQPIAVTRATTLSKVAQFANSVAPGGTAHIVAAVGGKTVTIQGGYMGFSISSDGAFAGNLESSAADLLVRARADTIVRTAVGVEYIPPVIYPLSDLAGVPLAAGLGLDVTNDGASAGNVYFSGYLLYTQV